MTMAELPFKTHPIITDVTLKAVPEGHYPCSTVIYVPAMKKHIVIFQAVKKILIQVNLLCTLKKFAIIPNNFLGIFMIFHKFFDSTDVHLDLLLRGCYMRWKQSVQIIVSNHAIVSPAKTVQFLSLTYKLIYQISLLFYISFCFRL